MHRRDFLQRAGVFLGAAALGSPRSLGSAESESGGKSPAPFLDRVPVLPRVRAVPDRIIRTTVCLRPFRAAGPRIEREELGKKIVVHNYGHGGSGWSLSWGSSARAVRLALESGDRAFAVIGAGALGMTSALLLQRAGKQVTIYARETAPDVRSSFATGVWSPDSRVCTAENATPAFGKTWEEMCRTSYRAYQNFLGLPGDPVEWRDRYSVSDLPFDALRQKREAEEGPVKFGRFGEWVKDLTPLAEDLPRGSHPFGERYVRRGTGMIFNLTVYQRLLTADFLAAGGRIERREFFSPADFHSVPERTLIHATGYGARALWGDESITPVRGQLAVLIPQPEITYSLSGEDVSMVSRRDGIVVQISRKTDFGSTREEPDRAEAEEAMQALAKICARMARG